LPALLAATGGVIASMLDQLAQYFYDPLIFWGAPLAIVLVWAGLRRAAAWLGRRRSR